jgi:trans-aconitate methyltransferase
MAVIIPDRRRSARAAANMAHVSPRDWNASSYDALSGPQQRWGEQVLARLELRGDEVVLDAGCGTGRVTIELARRGYDVAGIDVEPAMLDVARQKAPGLNWVLGDLATVALAPAAYDLVLAAGNVMIFLQLGTEAAVVVNLAGAIAPDGLLVAGFSIGRQLTLERYDSLAAAAGLDPVARFATWERAPYAGGDYAVSVHRRATDS